MIFANWHIFIWHLTIFVQWTLSTTILSMSLKMGVLSTRFHILLKLRLEDYGEIQSSVQTKDNIFVERFGVVICMVAIV